MNDADPLLISQIVVRVCLFVVAAIAMFGGALQFFLGQPETAPRLDNVHRFMAGVYFSVRFQTPSQASCGGRLASRRQRSR